MKTNIAILDAPEQIYAEALKLESDNYYEKEHAGDSYKNCSSLVVNHELKFYFFATSQAAEHVRSIIKN